MTHHGKDGITITTADIHDALAYYVRDEDMMVSEAVKAVRDDARRCGVKVSTCGPKPCPYIMDLAKAVEARPWT